MILSKNSKFLILVCHKIHCLDILMSLVYPFCFILTGKPNELIIRYTPKFLTIPY